MKKIIMYLSTLFCAICSLCGCSVNNNSGNNSSQYVTVSVENRPHMSINSANPLKLRRGEDAVFEIEIDKEYHFNDSKSEGTYIDGIYRVPNIQYSRTLNFNIKQNGEFTITIHNDNLKGKVSITPNEDTFVRGDEVTLSCSEIENNRFISYSYNAYSHNSNSYVKVGVPFSYSSTTKIIVEDDLDIYVNYYDESYYLISYDGNGGTTTQGDSKIVADFKMPNYQFSPNSIQGSRYFFRDGYVLTSWNTKSDGSGIRVGLGSKIPTSCCNKLTSQLYAIWEKETNLDCFSFVDNDDGTLSLSGYNENLNPESSIVIPRKNGNKLIRSIKENAIKTCKNRIVIADTILSIEDNGVSSDVCDELVFFTSLKNITTNSIMCPSIEKMYVNAATYTGNHEANVRDLTRKYDYVDHLDKSKKKFLMIGHSTLFQNHDVSPIAEKYTDYNIYKFGVTYGFPSDALIDLACSLLEKNDKVLYQFHEGASAKVGAGYDFLAYLDCNFDLFLKIDFIKYIKRFFGDYIKWRGLYTDDIRQPIFGYETNNEIDQYGNTVVMNKDDYDVSSENKGTSTITISSVYRKHGCYNHIMESLRNLPTKDVCIEWTTYNKNSINSMDSLHEFETIIREDFSFCIFLSSIDDNCLSGQYFRKNDNSHLNINGGNLRVSRWVNDLSTFLS